MTATDRASSTYNNRDRDAVFTRVVMEHARFLYRIAWSVLRHAEDAEDAVYSFSRWGSTTEGIDYWLTVVRGIKGSGVQFLYDNPVDEFVPS